MKNKITIENKTNLEFEKGAYYAFLDANGEEIGEVYLGVNLPKIGNVLIGIRDGGYWSNRECPFGDCPSRFKELPKGTLIKILVDE